MHRDDANLNSVDGGTSAAPASFCPPPAAGRVPDLVAPAGDWDCVKAAVENGADAIYFGLERHNARMRAANFTLADLPRLMEFLHRRGVKGYVTFNTLVFANELAEAEAWLRGIIAAGADAAIVQDVGVCRLIRRLSPDFPIHASTQMTITSAAGVEFARELGCHLVVLARECSIQEIEQIQEALAAPSEPVSHPSPFPLEVFIHGALCVAYSGQCLTSESLGGRSANRGVCAQACRMPFELICDGQPVLLGDRRYLLSPRDLAGLEVLPDLIGAGLASLKIEGRLKSPEYVANITRIYRKALDQLSCELPVQAHPAPTSERVTPSDHYDMEMAFSRGLHTGWLRGVNNKELVHARFGKKRGVFLGQVTRVQGNAVFLRLEGPLKPGDGVVFDAGRPDEDEEGGRVYEVQNSKSKVQGLPIVALAFGRGDVNFRRVHVGDRVWKTSDPELDRRLRQTFTGDQPRFQRPITLAVRGKAGQPLTLTAGDESGHVVELASDVPLAKAEKQPLTTDRLREQLGRMGGTPFRVGELKNELQGTVILPVSELNRLRREVVSRLEALRTRPNRWTWHRRTGVPPVTNVQDPVVSSETQDTSRVSEQSGTDGTLVQPDLIVLVRTLEQLDRALRCGVRTMYCELEDPKKYREAVKMVRSAPSGDSGSPLEIWVAPPRIFKPGEEWILQQVRSCNADGYLVRNYDHLKFFADGRCIGDYSLNIANALSADYFMNHFKLERVTASYDLNADQLEALLRSAAPEWFEVTIHQHMPMFHMEHCVFCSFLSAGTDYTNCGRPCEKHDVKLRDRVGAEHYLKADAGCRNTVFNALAQTGAESVSRLLALGARRFRLEFMDEEPDQVARTISFYQQLLRGEISGAQLWRELKLLNFLGVTRGPVDH